MLIFFNKIAIMMQGFSLHNCSSTVAVFPILSLVFGHLVVGKKKAYV